MRNKYLLFLMLLPIVGSISFIHAASDELKWEDVSYSPKLKRYKLIWSQSNEIQKAGYLELYFTAIQYSLKNLGKPVKELDPVKAGPRVAIFNTVTFEAVAMLYREYGDLEKAAQYKYKDWVDSKHSPDLMNADENPVDYVVAGYREAGMYKELAEFYSQAYPDKMKWLAAASNMKYFKTDFERYKKDWPNQAENYLQFMLDWEKAKELAKTAKPKPLDPAVQNHEWFYSDKQEEVLKALDYYHKFNVRFMLEKALKHKDPVIAAKAKEYLDTTVKEGAGNDKKK